MNAPFRTHRPDEMTQNNAAQDLSHDLPLYAAAPAASDQGIETVIVTATKRAEKLQDVPMGVGALTADTLQKLDATNFADYISRLPAMTMMASDAGHTQLILRGINTGGVGATIGSGADGGSGGACTTGAVFVR